MDEIIKQIAATTGLDPAVVQRAAGVVFSYLSREAPGDAVGALLDALPGSRDLAAQSGSGGGGGGGLMGVIGSLTGGGGLAALAGELSGAGLGMGDIEGFAKALLDQARTKAGADKVDAVVSAVPDLAQLI